MLESALRRLNAETELFRSAGVAYGEVFERFDLWLPRVHLECDFQYPARLDDRLRVAAYVSSFGNSSLRLNFDVLHVGENQLGEAASLESQLETAAFGPHTRTTITCGQLEMELSQMDAVEEQA